MENKSGVDAYQYFQKIQNCSGRKFINKLHSRSFSLNTFQINSLELLEATKKIRDPDLGLPLMSEGNREAGVQAHREINRYIHNFVASAKTLVDHTRVFMEEEYSGQSVMAEYLSKVKGALANEPVVKFVHDLRNYMLHKGLPNSQMFIELKKSVIPQMLDFSVLVELGLEQISFLSGLAGRRQPKGIWKTAVNILKFTGSQKSTWPA